MWSSSIRHEATFSSTLTSIDLYHTHKGNSQWIATGNGNTSLSVTWLGSDTGSSTTSAGIGVSNGSLYKSSFNLKGHIGEVKLVRWSPQGDRLATYDSWGYIKIWKNRANLLAFDIDYNVKTVVKDMQWSTCGCYVAIAGEEGYMQLLSGTTGAQIFSLQVVTSPRYGSYAQFTSLSWNKSITSIALATERGEIIDIDPIHQGRFISTMIVRENVPIQYISYYGPIKEVVTTNNDTILTQSLSLYLANGEVAIFHNLSTATCMCVHTRIINGQAKWNQLDTILAVIGYHAYSHSFPYLTGRFLDTEGLILYTIDQLIPLEPQTDESLLQSISWGISSLFIAHHRNLYSIDTLTTVPSLLQLCREYVRTININTSLLPIREIEQLNDMSSLIKPIVSPHSNIFDPLSTRLHCIITPDNNTSNSYTLQYEQMGSFITLLTADKRNGKFFNVYYNIKKPKNTQRGEETWSNRCNELNDRMQHRRLRNRYQTAPETIISNPLIIATISGNTLTKHYKFAGTSSQLGHLNVTSHYIKCEPRDLAVTLHVEREGKFELFSKKPEWNPQFEIFELDFGGRINKDSVKNFQLEWNNEIVYQFGKSMFDRYCLDFQYPFSPVTAFCVALSSLL